jgi:tetratricopeptide (TPR) repeat protein
MRLTVAIALVGLLTAAVATPAQSTWSRTAVRDILTQYATGDYAGALRAIEGVDQLPVGMRVGQASQPDDAFIDWQSAAQDWIRLTSWPTGVRRRQLVAATVALEIVRARSELVGYRRLSFLAWACELVRDHPTGSDAERLWYLTSIAVIQDASGEVLLQPAERNEMSLRRVLSPADRAELMKGHVAHAMSAFPGEGRFRLAEVLSRAALTSVIPFSASRNWMDANELPLKKPPTDRDQAKRVAERLATLPKIERDLEELARDEQIRAEVELNLGYLSVRQQRWDEALARLDRVAPTQDAFLTCISHDLRGWVRQRTGRRDDAIVEYRLALEASPHARSISTLLADQLAQAGRQTEAYEVLDAGLKASLAAADLPSRVVARSGRAGIVRAPDPPRDPWAQFQHGDARLISAYLTRLREALR